MAATASAADASRRVRRRDQASTAALLSGPLLWLLLFFLAPVVYVALYSVGGIKIFPTDAGVWSVGDWKHLLVGGSVYMGLFWKSVRISLTVSLVVVLLAYPVGLLPRARRPEAQVHPPAADHRSLPHQLLAPCPRLGGDPGGLRRDQHLPVRDASPELGPPGDVAT